MGGRRLVDVEATILKKMDIFCKKVKRKNGEVLAPGGHNFISKGPLGLKIVHKKTETELSRKTMVSISGFFLKTLYFQFFSSGGSPRRS